jgi:hypothetical protein
MICPNCQVDVLESERNCPSCGRDLGYPNVRAAKEDAEKIALGKRFESALAAAASQSYTDVFLRFQEATRFSKAVICRSVSKVKDLMSSDSELYANFYQLVGAGARRPEKGATDRERLVADSLMFPHYAREIRFAALSVDGIGLTDYGACSMVLRNLAINERATVFEENSLEFCRSRGLGVGTPVPPGYRAVWEERDLLACAKLVTRLSPSTPDDLFPAIIKSGRDFIEVHIHGSLHRGSLERIVVCNPLKAVDKVLISAIKGIVKRERLPIIVEERS